MTTWIRTSKQIVESIFSHIKVGDYVKNIKTGDYGKVYKMKEDGTVLCMPTSGLRSWSAPDILLKVVSQEEAVTRLDEAYRRGDAKKALFNFIDSHIKNPKENQAVKKAVEKATTYRAQKYVEKLEELFGQYSFEDKLWDLAREYEHELELFGEGDNKMIDEGAPEEDDSNLDETLTLNKNTPAKKIEIDIDGPDGNAYALLGYAKKIAEKLGYGNEEIKSLLEKMKSGDYYNLLRVFDDEFESVVTLLTDNPKIIKAVRELRSKSKLEEDKLLTEGSPEDDEAEAVAICVDEEVIGKNNKNYDFQTVEGWKAFLAAKKGSLPEEIFYSPSGEMGYPHAAVNYEEIEEPILQHEKDNWNEDDEEWDEDYVKDIISMYKITSIPYPDYFQYVMEPEIFEKVFGKRIDEDGEIFPATKKDVNNAKKAMRINESEEG